MKLDVSCTQGHQWQIDQRLAGNDVRCPECDETVHVPRPGDRGVSAPPAPVRETSSNDSSTTSTPKPRSLWSLMGSNPPAPPSPPKVDVPPATVLPTTSEASHSPAEVSSPAISPSDSAAESPVSRKRGLWSIMGTNPTPTRALAPSENATADADDEIVELEIAPASAATDDDSDPVELEPIDLETLRQPASDWEEDSITDDLGSDSLEPMSPANVPIPVPQRRSQIRTGPSRHAFHSLILGLCAIPAAAIAVIPAFWSRLPATILGFAALSLGLLAMQEIERTRGKMTGRMRAIAGMILGTVGMFLGPVIISRMELWDAAAQAYTRAHLVALGEAVDQYTQQYEDFPIGGTSRQKPDGQRELMHGWMTRLLPFVGELELYRSIDFEFSYDAPENAEAMRRTVTPFLASGADTSLVRERFGVSHFAGLGGDVLLEDGGFARAGVLGMNMSVNREDVLDGLSQTLIAGEIASGFPPWGDPENWRTTGKGLNKDLNGFGNASNTGAMFLMGDGSVRFFGNATDPELLRKLSTRDGEETLPQEEGIRRPVVP